MNSSSGRQSFKIPVVVVCASWLPLRHKGGLSCSELNTTTEWTENRTDENKADEKLMGRQGRAELKVVGKEQCNLCPRSIPLNHNLHTEGWARDREESAPCAASHQSELLAVRKGIQLASVTAGMAYPTCRAKSGLRALVEPYGMWMVYPTCLAESGLCDVVVPCALSMA